MSGLEPTINKSDEWRQALRAVWAILSIVALLVILSPFVVEHQTLLSLSAALQEDHPPGSCSLCGMTRAFLSLSRGEWRQAQAFNPYALGLWPLIGLNSLGLVYFIVNRLTKR